MRTLTLSCFFAVILVIAGAFLPLPALAVSVVSISSGGGGVFLLQGIGIEGASAFELTVDYDTATLSNPRITEGSLIAGAMTAINPYVPGIIRIVAIRIAPVQGSGVIATIAFDRTGASPGKINSLNVRLANSTGSPLSAQAQIINPPDSSTGSGAATPQNQSTSTTETAASAPMVVAPVVIVTPPASSDALKSSTESTKTAGQDIQATVPESTGGAGAEPVMTARAEDRAVAGGKNAPASSAPKTQGIYTQKSVLELFREYSGKRTAAALIALFDQESIIGCRQDPPIAFSDGKATVSVAFISTPGALTASDLAITGARLLSLKKDPDNTNTWIVELLPDKSAYEASLAVSLGELKMIYPLTIAPKISSSHMQPAKMSREDLDRYLEKQGSPAGAAAADLNGDGRLDYQDEYILIANYLSRHSK